MAKTQIEFYEALKQHIGEEGAKLIAEVVPADEIVTKGYLDAKFAEFKAEMRGWMLAFFVPLWIGVYATIAAILIKG